MQRYKINVIYNKSDKINDIFIKSLKKIIYKSDNIVTKSYLDLDYKKNGSYREL